MLIFICDRGTETKLSRKKREKTETQKKLERQKYSKGTEGRETNREAKRGGREEKTKSRPFTEPKLDWLSPFLL